MFKHFRVNELSLYILANRQYVADMNDYVSRIINQVAIELRR